MTSENTAGNHPIAASLRGAFRPAIGRRAGLECEHREGQQEALPDARDLICHYHFLENVGNQLCQKPHAKLTAALRRLKVCPALRSIRKDLVRWSRKGERLSPHQIEHLLSDPDEIVDLDSVALRRFVAYLLLRWLDDYKADLHGEYFPFDLPQLAFYRRGCQLADMLSEVVALPAFPQRELSTLKTIAGHLRWLRDDGTWLRPRLVWRKAAALFEELRKVLRLSSRPGRRWLRQRMGRRRDRTWPSRCKSGWTTGVIVYVSDATGSQTSRNVATSPRC